MVCWSVTLVSPAKTSKAIEMPFGLRTQVGPENHVLDLAPDPPIGRDNFEGKGAAVDTLRSPVRKRLNRS